MRTWSRSTGRADRCGNCGRELARNQPVMTLAQRGQVWKLLRCEDCAGEPPPADLAELPPLAPAQAGDASSVPAAAGTVAQVRFDVMGGNLRKPEMYQRFERVRDELVAGVVDVKARQAGE